VAAVARHTVAGAGLLRLGISLELLTDLLSQPLADLARAYPGTRVQARHMSTAAQLAALRAGQLDVGLVREHPIGHNLDAVLVVEERLGALLASHGLDLGPTTPGGQGLIAEVKFAAVIAGGAFAWAPLGGRRRFRRPSAGRRWSGIPWSGALGRRGRPVRIGAGVAYGGHKLGGYLTALATGGASGLPALLCPGLSCECVVSHHDIGSQ
jgi:DNA-binding transcriptional LysR family regulator